MLTNNQNAKRSWWISFRKVPEIACLIGLLVFAHAHRPLVVHFGHEHPIVAALAFWVVGMLSYHQDARRQDRSWAILSQTLAVVCLIAMFVFAFAHKLWPNLLIALPFVWLHVEFTRRWWTRPGRWW